MDDRTQWLSERAQLLFHTLTTWVKHLPTGTVHLTHELFPPDDHYGSELIVTLQPQRARACALTVGVISDTRIPYHFHLGDLARIAHTEGVVRGCTVPLHAPFFLVPHYEGAQNDLAAICQAVAEARVTLTLGILRGVLVAVESSLHLSSQICPLPLRGVGGPMGLVKLVRRFGSGELRPITFTSWL